MSSHVVVIASDLRRTTIKVTPGSYLTDVLQEACKKLSLPGDKYLIKHKQKQVDLSIPFRTSGLVSGAKLELVQKSNTPSAVQVALQVPQPDAREIPGGRLISKFPSDLPLWKVLRQFESGNASHGRNINITARGVAQTVDSSGSGRGQLYYETPVLNIMGRELATFADFQKTLSQMGYNSGNVLIRLTFRMTEQTLYEAMGQIGEFFKDVEEEHQRPDPANEQRPPPNSEDHQDGDIPMTDGPTHTSQPEQIRIELNAEPEIRTGPAPAQHESAPQPSEDRLKPVHVYLAPTGTTPAAASAPISESDYTPTVAHAQLHQTRLLEKSRNRRLPSDKEIEEKEAAERAKIAAVKSVRVKVRFPDNTSSEWEVSPSETGAFLYEAVRHVMASPEQPFKIVLPGGKTAIKNDAGPRHNLIKSYKLAGRVLVNLVWDDGVPAEVRKRPFLSSNVAQQGQAVKVPDVPKAVEESGTGQADNVPARPEKKDEDGEGGGKKKMPKWFKLGKK